MLRVGINGYGTIGKRVADAIRAQPDMSVAGVAKTRPNFEAEIATELGYPLYTAEERTEAFSAAGFEPAGTVDALVAESDVVVDATPAGVGAEYRDLYEAHDTPAVFQGGEDAGVADVSFTARANYDAATGAHFVRVVSCNTTGLARLIAPLRSLGIEKARVTLVRRGGDPSQADRGPINDAVLDPVSIPSHHGADLGTVLPEVPVDTLGLRVPTTLMHTHAVNLTLETTPSPEAIRERLADERRIIVLPEDTTIDGAGKLKELALDAGRPRGDYWENCVWGGSVAVRGRDCYLFQAIHQEADVVPENVDAVRALAGTADREESTARTDEHLGIGLTVAGPRRRAGARR